jgi:hypothetical protein
MILGARCSRSGGGTGLYYDEFPGDALDTAKWDTRLTGTGAAILVQSGKAVCQSNTSGNGGASIISKTNCANSGVLQVAFVWTPAATAAPQYKFPYVAIIPASPPRRFVYEWPYNVPLLRLADYSDTSGRTTVKTGFPYNDESGMTGTGTGSWALNTDHDVVWTIDFAQSKQSVSINGTTVINAVAYSGTLSGPLRVEFGISASDNVQSEKFTNINFTRAA